MENEKGGTLVDGFDEGLDVSLLAKNERGRQRVGIGGMIDRNSGGIVASVLQAAETIE